MYSRKKPESPGGREDHRGFPEHRQRRYGTVTVTAQALDEMMPPNCGFIATSPAIKAVAKPTGSIDRIAVTG